MTRPGQSRPRKPRHGRRAKACAWTWAHACAACGDRARVSCATCTSSRNNGFHVGRSAGLGSRNSQFRPPPIRFRRRRRFRVLRDASLHRFCRPRDPTHRAAAVSSRKIATVRLHSALGSGLALATAAISDVVGTTTPMGRQTNAPRAQPSPPFQTPCFQKQHRPLAM